MKLFSVFSWISVFLLAWLLIMGVVAQSPMVWGFWVFFLILAFGSSTVDTAKDLRNK